MPARRSHGSRTRHALAAAAAMAAALVAAAPALGEQVVVSGNSGSIGGTESVTAFPVAAAGGLLPATPVPTSERPEAVAISPDARFLYVTILRAPPGGLTDPGQVQAFSIGPGGALTEVPGSPFPSGGINTTGIAVTPDGERVLAVNRGSALNNAPDPGSIAVYDRDAATGALTAVAGSPFAVAGLENPGGIAITPAGTRVLVTGDTAGATFDSRVASLTLNPATGALAQVAGSPFDVGGTQLFPIVMSPAGNRIVAAAVGSTDQLVVADLSAGTGALTPVAGSPFPVAARDPIHLAMSPDGATLYSAERKPLSPTTQTEGVSVYALAADGTPTAIAGSPFLGAGGTSQAVAATSDGLRVFSNEASDPGFVAGYTVGGGDTLAPIAGSPYPTGDQYAGFFSIAITPSNTPVPAFSATVGAPGQPTAFDASATTVPGGRATRFNWNFGDGTTLVNGGPSPVHTYAQEGTYTVTLRVRNDCTEDAVFRNGVVFTGQTALCNGPGLGQTSSDVTVTTPPPAPTGGDPTGGGPGAPAPGGAVAGAPSPAACRPVPPRGTPATVRPPEEITAEYLAIDQRTGSATIRRANAIESWLAAGIEGRDVCGGALGPAEIGPSLVAATGALGPAPVPPDPRPVVIAAAARKDVAFEASALQMCINQRVYQAAIARTNALAERLAALRGGDVEDGTLGRGHLRQDLAVTAGTGSSSAERSTTGVDRPERRGCGVVRFTTAQAAINRRIAIQSVVRVNALLDDIASGLTDANFADGSLGRADFAAGALGPR